MKDWIATIVAIILIVIVDKCFESKSLVFLCVIFVSFFLIWVYYGKDILNTFSHKKHTDSSTESSDTDAE